MPINYGLPYRGSKNKIAAHIVEVLPPGAAIVDLFAGGCAVTHAALLSGKWGRVVANDLTDIPQLFKDSIGGKFHNETRWISRDDFYRLKNTDPYVRTCWSFGNDNRTYIYGREIEPYKRAIHYAVIFDIWQPLQELCPETCEAARHALQGLCSFQTRRVAIGRAIVGWLRMRCPPEMIAANHLYRSVKTRNFTRSRRVEGLERLQRLERLQSLQSLENLERLQSLQSLERLQGLQYLTITQMDYRSVELPPRAIIYADPPYKGTGGYNGQGFDHEAFYDWADSQAAPVFMSEYAMPADRFECIEMFTHRCSFSATANNAVVEKLFVQRRFAAKCRRRLFP